jgi:NAD(P)-dependent dehydrogenase (short-subunit alcohol dehydrogenase family)
MTDPVSGKIVLITGANRGIGRALLEEALRRGAGRVYAGSRGPFAHPDDRVLPLLLDVTDELQIRRAARTVTALDILINNAGVALYDDLGDGSMLERHLAVNLFGVRDVTRAFLPQLASAHGVIVNNLSNAAVAPFPAIPGYSISKAAALSLTQAQRALLAPYGIAVHAVLTGPTDTDMSRGLDVQKASPESVAQAIFDGVGNQEEDIFPDPVSRTIADGWVRGPAKALEREFAALAAAEHAQGLGDMAW